MTVDMAGPSADAEHDEDDEPGDDDTDDDESAELLRPITPSDRSDTLFARTDHDRLVASPRPVMPVTGMGLSSSSVSRKNSSASLASSFTNATRSPAHMSRRSRVRGHSPNSSRASSTHSDVSSSRSHSNSSRSNSNNSRSHSNSSSTNVRRQSYQHHRAAAATANASAYSSNSRSPSFNSSRRISTDGGGMNRPGPYGRSPAQCRTPDWNCSKPYADNRIDVSSSGSSRRTHSRAPSNHSVQSMYSDARRMNTHHAYARPPSVHSAHGQHNTPKLPQNPYGYKTNGPMHKPTAFNRHSRAAPSQRRAKDLFTMAYNSHRPPSPDVVRPSHLDSDQHDDVSQSQSLSQRYNNSDSSAHQRLPHDHHSVRHQDVSARSYSSPPMRRHNEGSSNINRQGFDGHHGHWARRKFSYGQSACNQERLERPLQHTNATHGVRRTPLAVASQNLIQKVEQEYQELQRRELQGRPMQYLPARYGGPREPNPRLQLAAKQQQQARQPPSTTTTPSPALSAMSTASTPATMPSSNAVNGAHQRGRHRRQPPPRRRGGGGHGHARSKRALPSAMTMSTPSAADAAETNRSRMIHAAWMPAIEDLRQQMGVKQRQQLFSELMKPSGAKGAGACGAAAPSQTTPVTTAEEKRDTPGSSVGATSAGASFAASHSSTPSSHLSCDWDQIPAMASTPTAISSRMSSSVQPSTLLMSSKIKPVETPRNHDTQVEVSQHSGQTSNSVSQVTTTSQLPHDTVTPSSSSHISNSGRPAETSDAHRQPSTSCSTPSLLAQIGDKDCPLTAAVNACVLEFKQLGNAGWGDRELWCDEGRYRMVRSTTRVKVWCAHTQLCEA